MEALVFERAKDKLLKTLGGIREMSRVPSAVWIVDTKKEHIAVGEARKLGIPVVAILDTNCDPDEVDYKIPGNDDAIRSAALLTRVIADAVADGLVARAAAAANAGRDEKPEPTAAPAEGAMIELASETDFVAKNEQFQTLAGDIVAHFAGSNATDVESLKAETLKDGKTVEASIQGLAAVIGEKLELRRAVKLDGQV